MDGSLGDRKKEGKRVGGACCRQRHKTSWYWGDLDSNGDGHDTVTQPTHQLPGSVAGAGMVTEDVPGEKSAEVGPHTTSLSFVPFTSMDFPSKEQLRQSSEKSSDN